MGCLLAMKQEGEDIPFQGNGRLDSAILFFLIARSNAILTHRQDQKRWKTGRNNIPDIGNPISVMNKRGHSHRIQIATRTCHLFAETKMKMSTPSTP